LKAKVADFGLSSRIYVTITEEFTQRQHAGSYLDVIPFRLAAYEILFRGEAFREKSDVWSFGVFMWEMFHLGSAEPYGDKKDMIDVKRYLKDGNRLLKPDLCPHSIFEVMSTCWLKNYEARPTFSQLKTQLSQFVSHVNYSRAEAHSTNVRQGDMAELIQNNRYLPMKSTSTQSSTLSSTTLSTLPHTLGDNMTYLMDLEREEDSLLGTSRASGHLNSTENTGYLVPFLSQRSEDSGYNQTYVLDSDLDNVFQPGTRRPRRNTTTIYI
jgi:serine/threonine protein kinase